jgi:peptidoglycan/xylan/chitin deacetylase (PgdA/CDA1 family)
MVKTYNLLRSAIEFEWRAARPLILMYHRITRAVVDPWELCVDPDRFEQHLDVLRRTRTPLSLEDFIGRLGTGALPKDAVAVTFDDGYADTFVNAKPLLASADIPATAFLPTNYLGRRQQFWWDELARLILLDGGLDVISCTFEGHARSFELGLAEPTPDVEPMRTWSVPLTRRRAAFLAMWKVLRHTTDAERVSVMESFRSKLSCQTDADPLSRPMAHSEVRHLVDGGLITIGAHTATHPSLPGLERTAREREIVESKRACEALIGMPITGFSYPYGEFSAEVQRRVKIAGFAYAVSTDHAHITRKSDRFALPRIQVLDWDGDSFNAALHSAAPTQPKKDLRFLSALWRIWQ